MRPSRLALPFAALLGAAIAVVPGIASGDPPTTASYTAVDDAWQANGGPGNAATIAEGGTVTFSYPTGGTQHNADFAGGAQPTTCSQTAGTNSGAVPPLPHQVTSPGWSGSCRFDTPGTYTFHCDLHTFMTATITVLAPSGTTTTTTTGTTGTTATTTTSTSPGTTTSTTSTTAPTTSTTPVTTSTSTPSTATPTSAPPPNEPKVPLAPATGTSVPAIQRGTAVNGSVRVSPTGAGGRMTIALLSGSSRVGTRARSRLPAGTVRFSVPIDPAARRTLHRHGRLAVTVQITVRSPRGATASFVRRIRLLSSA